MEKLVIDPTPNTPLVVLTDDGNLNIEGRSIPENPIAFYKPVLENLETLEATRMHIDIKLDYINTASTKQIFILLKKIDEDERLQEVSLTWHYELDDEDMLEAGEYYESLLKRIKFDYTSYVEMI
jgi:hypothetical protein